MVKTSLFTTAFVTVCILSATSAQMNPPYFERWNMLAKMAQDVQSSNGKGAMNAEQRNLVRHLLSLPSSVLQQTFLDSAERLLERESVLADVQPSTGANSAPVSSNVTISALCLNSTVEAIMALLEGQPWALQMLDAMGKPPPAIEDLNVVWPGAYDYCHKVRSATTSPPFSGQYCNLVATMGNGPAMPVVLTVGLCIPNTCSAYDYTILVNEVLAQLNVSVQAGVLCVDPDKPLDTRAIVAIVICSIILTMMVLGTAVDIIFVLKPKWFSEKNLYISARGHSCVDQEEAQPLLQRPDSLTQTPEPGTWVKVFLAFSVYTNGAKLLSTQQAPGSLTCVHGVRFLSMTWVVLGHSFGFVLTLSANMLPYYTEVLKRWTFQAIGNATVSVDTFFVLSGLLVAYLSLKEMKKRQGKMNWFLFYFHRFWRLTPAYMLLLMFYVCLFLYLGRGPFWPDMLSDLEFCESNWWTNLLYINNFVKADKMCFGHSWYLANDMQFYILSPLIFVPFYFSPVLGIISAGVFLLVTSIVPGVLTMQEHFPPGFLQFPTDVNNTVQIQADYMLDYYIKPYNRMGAYVVGMLAGYFLYRNDCKLRIHWITNLSVWAVATACALAVLYGLYDASNGHPLTLPVSAFYNAVNRQVWGACVCWVVIACVTGNGGFVNTILSWPALIPLSRLTYCIYLLHIMVIYVYVFSLDTAFYVNDITLVALFLAALVVSCMAAFVASLAFEAPMMSLEKLVLRRGERADNKESRN